MMDRKQVHRLVVERVLQLRGPSIAGLRLVSRLYNDELVGSADVRDVYFFLPDLHLLTHTTEACFRYGFLKAQPNVAVRRDVILSQLCDAMLGVWNALPTGQHVQTVQLGDFVDLWREAECGQGDPMVTNRILADHPAVAQQLVKRKGTRTLAAAILAGNHDPKSDKALPFVRRSLAFGPAGAETLLATHGDAFDSLELSLPDDLQEQMVEWFGPLATPGSHQLDRTLEGQPGGLEGVQGPGPLPIDDPAASDHLPDWVNVWQVRSPTETDRARAHELLPIAMARAAQVRAGKAKGSLGLDGAMPKLRTIVVGHSHVPRIVVARGDQATPDLVLADCGAWLESSRFGTTTVPSCHFGVLCGGDLRVYQLDPAPALITPC
jgi:hypothetical protein